MNSWAVPVRLLPETFHINQLIINQDVLSYWFGAPSMLEGGTFEMASNRLRARGGNGWIPELTFIKNLRWYLSFIRNLYKVT